VESVTVDKNNNVHIVMGITYKGAITPERAASLNASIVSKWSGRIGPYALNVTIIPGSQAKNGNTISVIEGKGRSTTSGNGARETTLYTKELNGASMEKVMEHEVAHLMGMSGFPLDKYYSNGEAHPGWEGNIMAVNGGVVDERNVNAVITFGRPYLAPSNGGRAGSTTQSSGSGSGPQGCMAKGGDCWH
jgi:hypothetical protein